jgi:amino acid efflux transporter
VLAGVEPAHLVRLTTGLFVTVYAVGAAAAVRLLPSHSKARVAALLALVAVVVLLVATGPYLVSPLVVSAAALLYLRLAGRGGR